MKKKKNNISLGEYKKRNEELITYKEIVQNILDNIDYYTQNVEKTKSLKKTK